MKDEFLTKPLDAGLQKLASSFDCGSNLFFNNFLRGTRAFDNNIGKTFVYSTDNCNKIIGYYNLGVGDIEYTNRSNQTIKCGGAVHINYFAVDQAFRGKIVTVDDGIEIRWSDLLLDDCLSRIASIRKNDVGFSFVTLSSTKEGLELYLRHDFQLLDTDMSFSNNDGEDSEEGTKMYLPLDDEFY